MIHLCPGDIDFSITVTTLIPQRGGFCLPTPTFALTLIWNHFFTDYCKSYPLSKANYSHRSEDFGDVEFRLSRFSVTTPTMPRQSRDLR